MALVLGLFGISGVGKTRLASLLAAREPRLLHLQASSLLRAHLNRSAEALRTDAPGKVVDNQGSLASAFAAARLRRERDDVILDAHSVIDTEDGLVDVPVAAIAPLGLTALAFLRAPPDQILRRRAKDSRQRPARSEYQLAEYQERALHVCQGYARDLDLPLEVLSGADHSDAAEQVERLIAGWAERRLDPPT